MATTRSFSAMLNDYLPNDLFKEELLKMDWLFANVDKDEGWVGGTLVVPFTGATATSVTFGSLTDAADVSEFNYQRGEISTQPEVWGTLVFNHRDLMEHGKGLNEKTFLKILPDQVDQFMRYMKEVCSINMLGASYFASATDTTDAATGVFIVDHPERFSLGQKCTIDDSDSNQDDAYVIAVNLNTSAVTLSDARGSTAFNFGDYVTATVRFYHDGVLVAGTVTNRFTSLRDSLLSAANGGTSTLYGKTKVTYPYLQAINVDGSGITAVNIIDKIFDAYTTCRTLARGNASTILLSYKHLGSIMKIIETQKGGFKVSVNSTKASMYGWTEIEVVSVKGTLKIVGIQEIDNDVIMLLDMSALKFYSNGLFRKRQAPDGKEYFEARATTGYTYLVDICLFGDLVLLAPSRCGIIHSIPAY